MGSVSARQPMDLLKILGELYVERKRLDRIITTLEELHLKEEAAPKRRGRKFMDPNDRKEVSQRMKRYWAKRRAEAANSSAPSAEKNSTG